MTDTLVVYRGEGEWSALYINGILDRVGDHYIIEERVFEYLKVGVVQSDSFMRGGNHREDVAKTLQEIDDYDEEQTRLEEQALYLEDQAHALLQQAAAIRGEKR